MIERWARSQSRPYTAVPLVPVSGILHTQRAPTRLLEVTLLLLIPLLFLWSQCSICWLYGRFPLTLDLASTSTTVYLSYLDYWSIPPSICELHTLCRTASPATTIRSYSISTTTMTRKVNGDALNIGSSQIRTYVRTDRMGTERIGDRGDGCGRIHEITSPDSYALLHQSARNFARAISFEPSRHFHVAVFEGW